MTMHTAVRHTAAAVDHVISVKGASAMIAVMPTKLASARAPKPFTRPFRPGAATALSPRDVFVASFLR